MAGPEERNQTMTRNELTAKIKIAQAEVGALVTDPNASMTEYQRAWDRLQGLMWMDASDDAVIIPGPATTHDEDFAFDEDRHGNAA
jgi:hypothetical protein